MLHLHCEELEKELNGFADNLLEDSGNRPTVNGVSGDGLLVRNLVSSPVSLTLSQFDFDLEIIEEEKRREERGVASENQDNDIGEQCDFDEESDDFQVAFVLSHGIEKELHFVLHPPKKTDLGQLHELPNPDHVVNEQRQVEDEGDSLREGGQDDRIEEIVSEVIQSHSNPVLLVQKRSRWEPQLSLESCQTHDGVENQNV